jgi:2-polyprenyl-3-methyl-5-hydroxy-6-metoxy-1,4-benzoquinol methylase
VENSEQPIDTASYSEWKGWTQPGVFGRPERGDTAYYSRELRDIPHPINDVLEVGFGSGTFLAYCRSQGWSVTGTELSPEQVALAQGAGFAARLADQVDQLPDGSFDLIAAFDVFEHIPERDSITFLTVLASKLRPSGAILLRYPNADTWLSNPFQYGDPTHVTAIGYHKMQYFAANAGLDIRAYRAPTRRGFRTSLIHGAHLMTAGVLVKLIAGLQKVLYFPGVPLVMSSSNVLCVLAPRRRSNES